MAAGAVKAEAAATRAARRATRSAIFFGCCFVSSRMEVFSTLFLLRQMSADCLSGFRHHLTMHRRASGEGEDSVASERRSPVDRESFSSINDVRERCRRLLSGSKLSAVALAWIVAAVATAAAPGAEVRFCLRLDHENCTASSLSSRARAVWRAGLDRSPRGPFCPIRPPPRPPLHSISVDMWGTR